MAGVRQMCMGPPRVIAAITAVAMFALVACTGTASVPVHTPTGSRSGSPSLSSPGTPTIGAATPEGLQGIPTSASRCPTSLGEVVDLNPHNLPAQRVTAPVSTLIICDFPGFRAGPDLILTRTNSQFAPDLALLSRPTQLGSKSGCPGTAKGQANVVILAMTSAGSFLVTLPRELCGAYLTPVPRPF